MAIWGLGQAPIFHGVDILITGGLLGGGSQGIHKIIALITDFVDVTRAKVKQKHSSHESCSYRSRMRSGPVFDFGVFRLGMYPRTRYGHGRVLQHQMGWVL